MRSLIDRLLGRNPPPDAERLRKDAEVAALIAQSAETLKRVERLVRLARIDAEMAAASAKQRVLR